MARRRSSYRNYRRRRSSTVNYYTNVRYGQSSPGGQPVLGAILQLIVLFALLAAIVVTVGPLIDYFSVYVSALPADADGYKNAVLPLYPWTYSFIVLTGVVGFVVVFRNVIRTIVYGRWME